MKRMLWGIFLVLLGCTTNPPPVIKHCVSFKSDFANDLDYKKYNKCYIDSEKSLKSIEGKRVYSQVIQALEKKEISVQQTSKTANCVIHLDFGTETKSFISNQAILGNTGYSSSNSYYNPILNSVSTTYTPSYGVIGYTPVQKNVSLHYLSMMAITKDGSEIWNTLAVYDVGVFDRVFPMLLELSIHFLGTQYNNKFCYTDDALRLIQQGRNNEVHYF